jgi:hypothetical protein
VLPFDVECIVSFHRQLFFEKPGQTTGRAFLV